MEEFDFDEIHDHEIKVAKTEAEIRACYPILKQLRAQLRDEQDFLDRVTRQGEKYDYHLVYLIDDRKKVCSTAGFRIAENLAWGRYMYVDDMVTCEEERHKGYGGALLEWLIGEARRRACEDIQLDSAVHRFPAHRLYMSRGLSITSHHFTLLLTDA